MTDRLLGRVLALMLAALLPAATMSAETHPAMLYATNAVTLNGVGAANSSAVFSGDTIQTPADSAVTLTAQGSTVLVGPSSLLVYQGDAVRLSSGSTMVTTENSMKTQIQKLVVTPASEGRSSYRVVRGSGKVMIAALRGSVKLTDGSSEKLIAEGNATTIADPEPLPQADAGVSHGAVVNKGNAIALGAGVGLGVLIGFVAWETTKSSNRPLSPP
ncbi:MAG: hypothetical protein LAN64_04465 [Acidobacteriia bacterium]|nr:hypothetical protein [Terriglobia bacterium]